MALSENGLSASDVALLTGNNNNDGFMGGNGAWWIIILFLFAFCGWGGNWGNGSNGGGVQDAYVLNSDFSQLSRQLDTATDRLASQGVQIANGLCDGFYTQAQLVNGVQQNLATQGYETRNAITQAQIAQMQSNNAIQTQIASCCCDNREAIAGVNYNMAMNANNTQNAINTGFCQTNYNNQSNTRDILESQNANTRAILDAIQANKVEALKDRIAEQNQQINALQLSASQQAQNAYLIDQLGTKCPIPAYLTCNPNAPLNYSVNYGCGCNA